MSSGAAGTMIDDMRGVPRNDEPARLDRARERRGEHSELSPQPTAAGEVRGAAVRARLERELGSELTRMLIAGLAHAA